MLNLPRLQVAIKCGYRRVFTRTFRVFYQQFTRTLHALYTHFIPHFSRIYTHFSPHHTVTAYPLVSQPDPQQVAVV